MMKIAICEVSTRWQGIQLPNIVRNASARTEKC